MRVPMEVLFAGVAVGQLSTGVDWCGGFFGRPPDIVPHEREVMWRVTDSGWLYVIADGERAGSSQAVIPVGDLDGSLTEIAARGIVAGPVDTVGDAGRKATVIDPGGNSVALVQVTPQR